MEYVQMWLRGVINRNGLGAQKLNIGKPLWLETTLHMRTQCCSIFPCPPGILFEVKFLGSIRGNLSPPLPFPLSGRSFRSLSTLENLALVAEQAAGRGLIGCCIVAMDRYSV